LLFAATAMAIDDARLASLGIRKLKPAARLTLYTDLPSSPAVDSLPELFDQAFPQWCQYFHVSPAEHAGWRMTGCLIKDKRRFQEAGLLPESLPPFEHGFCVGHRLWLYEHETDYYKRHLLLHEGTHGFMNTILGGCGPPWYMEGTAELLATHRLRDGRLTLNVIPTDRREAPDRIRRIKDAVAQHRAMRLRGIIEYSDTAHLEVEPYAWCWALSALLDRHPRYRDRFRGLYRDVLTPDFNTRFYRLFAADWRELIEEWGVFISGMEYGYDVARTVLDFTPGEPLPPDGAKLQVAADRGWQNSRLALAAGTTYCLAARGRYQVGTEPQPWWCEPNGVSLRYYQGRPLGILLAAVRPDKPANTDPIAFLRPQVVGLSAVIRPERSGTLYLKINHSAGELQHNSGELSVEVKAD
jgi:hypothetical protein